MAAAGVTAVEDMLALPELDPASASHLMTRAAMVVCVGVPAGTMLGLDYASWQVGPKFQGVKLVPPGVHFLWFSATSRTAGSGAGDVAPRTGFFFTTKPQGVAVCTWDGSTEELLPPGRVPEGVASGFVTGARRGDFDAGLGPYPLKTVDVWRSLVTHVTPAVLDRVAPVARVLSSTAAVVAAGRRLSPDARASRVAPASTDAPLPSGGAAPSAAPSPAASSPPAGVGTGAGTGASAVPTGDASTATATAAPTPLLADPASVISPTRAAMEARGGAPPSDPAADEPAAAGSRAAARDGELRAALHAAKIAESSGSHFFTRVKGVGLGAKPADRTQYAMDTTAALVALVDAVGDAGGVVGELQVAFVSFLMGQDLEAFQHWKHLVDVVCRCEAALCAPPASVVPSAVLAAALTAVAGQVTVLPTDLFDDALSGDNFLRRAFRRLVRCVPSMRGQRPAVATAALAVAAACRQRFGWDPAAPVAAAGAAPREGAVVTTASGDTVYLPPDSDASDDDDPPAVVDLGAPLL